MKQAGVRLFWSPAGGGGGGGGGASKVGASRADAQDLHVQLREFAVVISELTGLLGAHRGPCLHTSLPSQHRTAWTFVRGLLNLLSFI